MVTDSYPKRLPVETTRPASAKRVDHRISRGRFWREWMSKYAMGAIALFTCSLIVFIAVALTYRAWPIVTLQPLGDLLRGQVWQPMRGLFGFAPFIAGSVAVTLVALLFSVVPAVLSGLYLSEYTSTPVRSLLKPVLDLLVAIPSVVYGLWGVLFVVPLVRDWIGPLVSASFVGSLPIFARSNPSGYGLLSAGFVLGIMVFPLIVAVTDEVMRSVPREMREAALCLGATRWEATRAVLRYRAAPGVLAAVVLGFSRAFGETLAVMMLIGNVPHIPRSLFDGAYSLSGLIANNYGEMMSVPLYDAALMGAALMLLAVVLIFNVGARLVIVRMSKGR